MYKSFEILPSFELTKSILHSTLFKSIISNYSLKSAIMTFGVCKSSPLLSSRELQYNQVQAQTTHIQWQMRSSY